MGTWQNGQGINQDVAKKCGSKWELGKMDRALTRMQQKRCGSKWELGKMDRVLIMMWQFFFQSKWELGKMDKAKFNQDVVKSVGLNGNLHKI